MEEQDDRPWDGHNISLFISTYVSAVEVAISLGMLLGGGLISLWGGFKNRIHTMLIAVFGIALAMMIVGLPIPFTVYLCCIFVAGMLAPMILTPANVILQENVESRYLGRVSSVISTVSSSMTPLGMLVFGPLADKLPISWLLIATGVLVLCLGIALCFDKVAIRSGWRSAPDNAQNRNRAGN